MRKRILVVEDDKNISKLIKYNLEKSDYDCTTAVKAEDALEILNLQAFDLIILDIMLPKMDGFEACCIIKHNPDLKDIPIIMLTAKGEEVDRILGFEFGADDYIVKPFSVRELMLRVRAILKRGERRELEQKVLRSGSLTVDILKHKVSINKKEVELAPMEFKLLVSLMEGAGRVQTRERLLSEVWDIDADISTRTIDTHIKRLREKLEKLGDLIETIRGLGYKFKEED